MAPQLPQYNSIDRLLVYFGAQRELDAFTQHRKEGAVFFFFCAVKVERR